MPYTPLATNDEDDEVEDVYLPAEFKAAPALSIGDKWHLVKPLLAKYMLPLCTSIPLSRIWYFVYTMLLLTFSKFAFTL